MTNLKLLALDTDDLAVISAHMQDSVLKVGDLAYDKRAQQFSLVANRFVWETADERGKPFERRRAVIGFKRVQAVRSVGIDRKGGDAVLALLAIRFEPKGEGPDGTLELTLAGKATIALDVECIEVQLADVGGAWQASSKPNHPDGA